MKRILSVLLILVLLGGIGGFMWYRSRYATIGDEALPRETVTELDLRGQGVGDLSEVKRCTELQRVDLRENALTVEQIDSLRAVLPNCFVRWSIPLGGNYYDSESTELAVADLDMDDWENIYLFPSLRSLTVGRCTRFERLTALQEDLPELNISYNVSLDGKWYRSDTAVLSLNGNPEVNELSLSLSRFTDLSAVRITGCTLSSEERRSLRLAYPHVRFDWDVELMGETYGVNTSALSFRNRAGVNMADLTDRLSLFPYLREVDLSGCGFSLGELQALQEAYPHINIRWEYSLLGRTFSSDAEEIDLSKIKMENTAEVEAALPWFPHLKKVIMSDCGFKDDEMDALNQRYDNIRFVWTVYFGTFSMRTDETQFIAARFQPWVVLYDTNCYCLKYCTDLEALDFGHMAVRDLSFLEYMPHMKYLVLAECPITDLTPLKSLKELKYLEIFKAPLEDLSPLLEVRSLEDLNICYIWIKSDLAFEQLSQMTWLDRLWYCGTYWTDQTKEELQQLLPDCELDLRWGAQSTGGTWRKHPHYYEMRDAFYMYYMPGGTNGVDEDGNGIIYYG